jgi:hypothetical protein
VAAVAVPPTAFAALVSGQEYFAFMVRIQHTKTVGTGQCAGCCTPVNLVFNAIKVVTPVAADDRTITGPTNGIDSHFARWQGGFQTYAQSASMAPPPCGESVPTRARTWSELKALYR